MGESTEKWREEEILDLRMLFSTLWAGRRWIGVSALLCMLIAGVVAFLTTPVYRASTVLVSGDAERTGLGGSLGAALGSLGGLASLAGINVGGSGSIVDESLAVLRSRQFTESFIQDNNLMPKLFPKKWDAARNTWRADEKPPTLAKAVKLFARKIRSVSQDKKTNLVTLQIDWTDRNEAAAWANELAQRLNAEMRTRAIAKTDASIEYLQKELLGASVVETRRALNKLLETQINQRMISNVSREYAFRVVDRAMAPDSDDVVKPRPVLSLVAGLLAGLFLGAIAVFYFRREGQ